MLKQALTNVFRNSLQSEAFFAGWQKEKPREYWSRGDGVHLGIELQLDKWWQKAGGNIAINLWCGHRWSIPTLGWVDRGVDYGNVRLSPRENCDHWWQIRSDSNVEEFAAEFDRLLLSHAIPWFQKVTTKEGYMGWYAGVFSRPSTLPYLLELHGRRAALEAACEWLWTSPRGIERTLNWLESVSMMSSDLARRFQLASIQSL